jgi:hypothetical protein
MVDTSVEGQTAQRKYVTGALIIFVAVSFVVFLGVIVKFWITQPEPSAILDIEADSYYDQAKIVIESPSQAPLKKTINISSQSKYRFILNPGVIKIKISREDAVFYQDSVDIRPGQMLLMLKPPGAASSQSTN